MNSYLELYRNIINMYNIEIQKLQSKQEELNKREQDILTIKDNTTQILQLLKEQQQKPTIVETKKQEPSSPTIERKIRSLNKTKEIEHNSNVLSITELSNSRMLTGDSDGYIRLFAVDDEKGQWTKKKEEKGHDD